MYAKWNCLYYDVSGKEGGNHYHVCYSLLLSLSWLLLMISFTGYLTTLFWHRNCIASVSRMTDKLERTWKESFIS
jgi:hypothetical protein